jgi:hypothetical protein
MLTLLVACNGSADPARLDADRDGAPAPLDCDDADPSVWPLAPETPEDGVDQDCDGVDPLAERTLLGELPGEGFGARVLLAGDEIVVGAPFWAEAGSRVSGRVAATGGARLAGGDQAFLGAGLAWADGAVIVGAPGSGRVTTLAGDVLQTRAGLGGVLVAGSGRWYASTPDGAMRDDGATTDWGERPSALAVDTAGAPWGGFARGSVAFRSPERGVGRASTGDEAGFSLLFGDVDNDGTEDLVVGAPGAGVVYILDPSALPSSLADATAIGPGTGRFGASLALGMDGVLYVGAPMAGSDVAGAVYAVRNRVYTLFREGPAPRDELGASLSAGRGTLVIGAPGTDDGTGAVHVVIP